MLTLVHLKLGQKGTTQILVQYSDCRVCVRCRYDAQQKKWFKTGGIVTEGAWEPSVRRVADTALVGVRVGFAEVELRQRVKRAGSWRNRRRQVWELRHDLIVAFKLAACLIKEEASPTRYQC
jgi:hypothetical protein